MITNELSYCLDTTDFGNELTMLLRFGFNLEINYYSSMSKSVKLDEHLSIVVNLPKSIFW